MEHAPPSFPARAPNSPTDLLFENTIPPLKNKVQKLHLATPDFPLQHQVIFLILLDIIFLATIALQN
jgi:hypothetical protein